ncbi:MAG: hypothetical protein IJK84_00235 [Bacteroidales bacterium]|nr:hypothetical protein [Bacteroidales bacterium]
MTMNATFVKWGALWRVVAIDALLLMVACLVPTLSHLLAWPLYQLNPMMLVLLAGMLLVGDRRNAYLLAVLLPVVSMLAVGMPTPLKALCMVAEYATLVFVCGRLQAWNGSWLGRTGALLVAVLAGKVVYYMLKALVLAPAVLVGTSVWLQLGVAVVAAVVYGVLKAKN